MIRRDLDRPGFESLLTEAEPISSAGPISSPRSIGQAGPIGSPGSISSAGSIGSPGSTGSARSRGSLGPLGGSLFDSQIGFAIRRWCAPLLDLEPHAAPDAYLERRAELGHTEVTGRMLRAAGLEALCVDTGFEPEPLLSPQELGQAAGASSYEIVRLEQVAEQVVKEIIAGDRGYSGTGGSSRAAQFRGSGGGSNGGNVAGPVSTGSGGGGGVGGGNTAGFVGTGSGGDSESSSGKTARLAGTGSGGGNGGNNTAGFVGSGSDSGVGGDNTAGFVGAGTGGDSESSGDNTARLVGTGTGTGSESGSGSGSGSAGFADAVRARLAEHARTAVGFKSIAAYRYGLDLAGERPADADVTAAADRWLTDLVRRGPGAPVRLVDETLHRFLIWCGVDLGVPIQFHVGYGDADVDLDRCDPLLLTRLLRAIEPTGVPVLLLHNYPFHRHAGYLAQVYSNVFLDVGLATHNLGHGSRELIAQALELAPFGKFLYSSDAFALPELHYLGAQLFRRGLADFLRAGVEDDAWTGADADRVAELICAGNARRVYRLDAR
ncbi:MAG TPA: amidohydrolase family protein [Actinocrinis sp.]|nr:amidohydrolase family protein [Actinocrinis sp.]HEV2347271.1 amidohydrolase family protein [Actinocrinis sp.]